jgi:uncharacterized membrane protein YfcA
MISLWQYPLLLLTGLAAGFVDSIAGGGGLITLPVLLNFGFDPQHALGTNKLQATFGSGSAAWHYVEAKAVAPRDCTRGFLCSFGGAATGALVVQEVSPSFLRRAIPILLIAVAVYMLIKPRVGCEDARPRLTRWQFDVFVGLSLGFYDGFFGPGVGTFWAIAYVLGLGFNLTRATGYAKVMNFASNLSSLALFVMSGNIALGAGLIMGAGQLLGARIGARMVLARGTRFIRPIFLTVALAITAKLLYDSFWK